MENALNCRKPLKGNLQPSLREGSETIMGASEKDDGIVRSIWQQMGYQKKHRSLFLDRRVRLHLQEVDKFAS